MSFVVVANGQMHSGAYETLREAELGLMGNVDRKGMRAHFPDRRDELSINTYAGGTIGPAVKVLVNGQLMDPEPPDVVVINNSPVKTDTKGVAK